VISYDGSISEGHRCADFISSYCIEAILTALELGYNYGWPKLIIFSDSKSILSAVNGQFDHQDKSHLILFISPSFD